MIAPPPRCPRCGDAALAPASRRALDQWICKACGAAVAASGPRAQETPLGEPLERMDRLAFGHPWVDLLALPSAFLAALLLTASSFGRLLAFPIEIVFHELGHAVPSWLSSRAALPLPCGITFHSESQSAFTGLCFVFLLGVLAYRGYREERPFVVGVAAACFALFLVFSLLLSAERTEELILLGGIAGELWLSALVIASFYFPMPDRLRWDFFRVLLLPIACVAFVATTRLWWGVAAGTSDMPLGSLFGGRDDGAGDLDRLMIDFGWFPEALVHVYLRLALACGAALFGLYAAFAVRAVRRLRAGA
jgi:hypothetical protein